MIFKDLFLKNQKMYKNRYKILFEESDDEDPEICVRTQAFQTLKDKKSISSTLFKTKMCAYVTKKLVDGQVVTVNECTRKNCHFAHSHEELVMAPCVFGDLCKFRHAKTRPCTFLHPGETLEEFRERTGQNLPGKTRNLPLILPIVQELVTSYPS